MAGFGRWLAAKGWLRWLGPNWGDSVDARALDSNWAETGLVWTGLSAGLTGFNSVEARALEWAETGLVWTGLTGFDSVEARALDWALGKARALDWALAKQSFGWIRFGWNRASFGWLAAMVEWAVAEMVVRRGCSTGFAGTPTGTKLGSFGCRRWPATMGIRRRKIAPQFLPNFAAALLVAIPQQKY
ncbi:hypothetical protein TIFTF001_050944 [Ficus carica]|uniref:Uncharacterized protein n=1 Tax=Ficus carica TaxID=3494 RepID=A0AA87YWY0_FICCA|nr:hypothetical protein TIFTF001_050944 [Ficus carica]